MKYVIRTIALMLWFPVVSGCGALPGRDPSEGSGPAVPLALCGDGLLQPGEECDDGALNRNDTVEGCRIDCTRLECGADSFAGPNENGEVSCIPHILSNGDIRIEERANLGLAGAYTSIGGNLVIIGDLPESVSFSELREIRGNLWVWDTTSLVNLSMDRLERVTGDILFRNNRDLEDLEFGSLREVGGNLAIAFNGQLPTCVAERVTREVGEAHIQGIIKIEANKPDSCN